MNSKLSVESTINIGINFYFELETKTALSSKKIIGETILKEPSSKKELQQLQYKILIVEDNKINLLLAKTLVQKIYPNAKIYEATNGEIAIHQAQTILPDIIIMDIQMPIMNGYEATIEIRKIPQLKNTPIIALTAGTIIGERERCIEVGMNDYASKPIIKEELENRFKSISFEKPLIPTDKTKLGLFCREFFWGRLLFWGHYNCFYIRVAIQVVHLLQNAPVPAGDIAAHWLYSVSFRVWQASGYHGCFWPG